MTTDPVEACAPRQNNAQPLCVLNSELKTTLTGVQLKGKLSPERRQTTAQPESLEPEQVIRWSRDNSGSRQAHSQTQQKVSWNEARKKMVSSPHAQTSRTSGVSCCCEDKPDKTKMEGFAFDTSRGCSPSVRKVWTVTKAKESWSHCSCSQESQKTGSVARLPNLSIHHHPTSLCPLKTRFGNLVFKTVSLGRMFPTHTTTPSLEESNGMEQMRF